MQYIDDYKRKLKILEDAEKEEWLAKRQKNKDLADYQKLQYEERKRLALDNFRQFNEDSYKNLRRLEIPFCPFSAKKLVNFFFCSPEHL